MTMYKPVPVFREIAVQRDRLLFAPKALANNDEIARDANIRLASLMTFMPQGGGFDNGTKLVSGTHPDVIKFTTEFHDMDNGTYTETIEFVATLMPTLLFDYSLLITTGKGQGDAHLMALVEQTFEQSLRQLVQWDLEKECYIGVSDDVEIVDRERDDRLRDILDTNLPDEDDIDIEEMMRERPIFTLKQKADTAASLLYALELAAKDERKEWGEVCTTTRDKLNRLSKLVWDLTDEFITEAKK